MRLFKNKNITAYTTSNKKFISSEWKNSISIFIFLFTFIHSTFLFGSDFQYDIDSLTTDDGLSYNKVCCIYQDTRGFIWIGTRYGLNRFDGNVFKTYYHDPYDSTTLSNNFIWSTLEDSYGNFWVGTADGLNRYDRIKDKFQRYTIRSATTEPIMFSVRVIIEDSYGEVWFGTTDGLKRYDRLNKCFFHYEINTLTNGNLAPNFVISIYEDQANRLWIGTRKGLYKYDRAADSLLYTNELSQKFDNKNITVSSTLQDEIGTFWLGTWGSGMHIFAKKIIQEAILGRIELLPYYSNIYTTYKDHLNRIWIGSSMGLTLFELNIKEPSPFNKYQVIKTDLKYKEIRCFFEDKSGIVWIGTGNYGVYRYIPRLTRFENYNPQSKKFPIKKNRDISAIVEIRNGLFWMGTTANQLFEFNRALKSYKPVKNISGIEIPYFIGALLIDRDRDIWIGDRFGHLFRYTGKNNKIVHYKPDSTCNSLKGIFIAALHEDQNGFIWIGTDGSGLNRFDKSNHEFIHFQRNPLNQFSLTNNGVTVIHEDKSANIWIGTSGGGLNKYLGNDRFIHYLPNSNNKNSLSEAIILSIHEDNSGQFWIGTANGGLNKFDPMSENFQHFGIKDGFPSNRIFAITDDDKGNLWISTSKGITKFNPITKAIRNYDRSDGLLDDDFDKVSFCKCKSGELIFGGKCGFTIFHPDSLFDNPYVPPVYLTDFKILNKPVKLDTAISEKKHIALRYDQNVISFEFAGLNYIHPEKNQYQYKMAGFDRDWIHAGNRRYASYSNLSPGNYTFRVKASNNNGVWNNKGAALSITITPPWWQTTIAYMIYFIIFCLIVFGFYRIIMYRAKIRNELNMQRFEANKMREIDEMKSSFFANISHEFRTPLTLILGPIEDFLSKHDGAKYRNIFEMMHRNAQRLLRLINQLLDLSKIEAGSAKLELKRTYITDFVKAQVNSFLSWAERKKIELKFVCSDNEIIGMVDPGKLEKIISNLVSNALKFTAPGGKILVQLRKEDPGKQISNKNGYLELKVIDNGTGIPEEKHAKIFDRFYQTDSSMTREYQGTGIGLSLTKELVELHGGEIHLESKENKGSTFTVTIPLHKEPVDGIIIENEPGPGTSDYIISKSDQTLQDDEIVEYIPDKSNYKIVLVVDDNVDVRNYIGESLRDEYKILYAANGKQAFKIATAKMPDLIISDVMMPYMDGFEFCKQIKLNIQTSHIPVILLTAKATEESKLEGLETGADDYLIKPFNKSELKARTKNLIEQRERLREYFSREILLQPGNVDISSMDEEFLNKAIAIIKSHLSDDKFSVVDFSQEIGMVRQQLTRKLKSVTGYSTQDFIRKIRLDHAAIHIKNKSATITEIAYKVGFDSSAYFTKCFKQQFGCLPSEYNKKS